MGNGMLVGWLLACTIALRTASLRIRVNGRRSAQIRADRRGCRLVADVCNLHLLYKKSSSCRRQSLYTKYLVNIVNRSLLLLVMHLQKKFRVTQHSAVLGNLDLRQGNLEMNLITWTAHTTLFWSRSRKEEAKIPSQEFRVQIGLQ
jgi:hypothetical protein